MQKGLTHKVFAVIDKETGVVCRTKGYARKLMIYSTEEDARRQCRWARTDNDVVVVPYVRGTTHEE